MVTELTPQQKEQEANNKNASDQRMREELAGVAGQKTFLEGSQLCFVIESRRDVSSLDKGGYKANIRETLSARSDVALFDVKWEDVQYGTGCKFYIFIELDTGAIEADPDAKQKALLEKLENVKRPFSAARMNTGDVQYHLLSGRQAAYALDRLNGPSWWKKPESTRSISDSMIEAVLDIPPSRVDATDDKPFNPYDLVIREQVLRRDGRQSTPNDELMYRNGPIATGPLLKR